MRHTPRYAAAVISANVAGQPRRRRRPPAVTRRRKRSSHARAQAVLKTIVRFAVTKRGTRHWRRETVRTTRRRPLASMRKIGRRTVPQYCPGPNVPSSPPGGPKKNGGPGAVSAIAISSPRARPDSWESCAARPRPLAIPSAIALLRASPTAFLIDALLFLSRGRGALPVTVIVCGPGDGAVGVCAAAGVATAAVAKLKGIIYLTNPAPRVKLRPWRRPPK